MLVQFLLEAVVMEAVVTGQRDQSAPACRQGEEDLIGGVVPNLKCHNKHTDSAITYCICNAYIQAINV